MSKAQNLVGKIPALRSKKRENSILEERYTVVPSRFAKCISIAFWILGAALMGCSLAYWVDLGILALLPVLLGASFLFMAFELSNPNSKRVQSLQDRMEADPRWVDWVKDSQKVDNYVSQHTEWSEKAFSKTSCLDYYYGDPITQREHKYRKRVVSGINVFSFGKLYIDEDFFCPSKDEVANPEWRREWEERVEVYRRQAVDLDLIWSSMLSPAKLNESDWHGRYFLRRVDSVQEMGRNLGIDGMVEAYVEGVPVEDIVA